MYFIEQPVTSVECLIYEEAKIVLTCTVTSEGISDPTILDPNEINIKWYYYNGTDHELITGTNTTTREGGNGEHIIISSRIQENTADLAVGSYYC